MVEENPIIKSEPVGREENPFKKIVINFSYLEPRLSSGNSNQLSPNKRAFSQIKCQVPPSKKSKKTESFEKEPKKCSILFKCPKCDFSSNSSNSLTQHIETSHRKFIDNLIIVKKEQVLLAKSLEKNTLKSKPVIFENPLISQTLIWIKEELNEINDVQNDNSDFNNFVEVSEPNEDCQKSFEKSELGDPVNYIIENCDINSLHNFELEDPLSTNSVHEGENVFQCKVCNSGFKHKTSLFEHINTVHEENKPFKCSVCGVGFAIEDTLKRHILVVHEGEKTFKCRECDSTFIDRSSWRTHFTSVHEGKKIEHCLYKRFMCFKCGQKFIEKDDLRNHTETFHEENKRFTCLKCGQKFIEKDILRKHTETVHKETKFECEKCDSSFLWKQSLKKHVDKCHPNKKGPNLNGQS